MISSVFHFKQPSRIMPKMNRYRIQEKMQKNNNPSIISNKKQSDGNFRLKKKDKKESWVPCKYIIFTKTPKTLTRNLCSMVVASTTEVDGLFDDDKVRAGHEGRRWWVIRRLGMGWIQEISCSGGGGDIWRREGRKWDEIEEKERNWEALYGLERKE